MLWNIAFQMVEFFFIFLILKLRKIVSFNKLVNYCIID